MMPMLGKWLKRNTIVSMIKDHDLLIKLKELDIIVEGTKFMPRAPSQIASNIL